MTTCMKQGISETARKLSKNTKKERINKKLDLAISFFTKIGSLESAFDRKNFKKSDFLFHFPKFFQMQKKRILIFKDVKSIFLTLTVIEIELPAIHQIIK